jgi:hypothetical protein
MATEQNQGYLSQRRTRSAGAHEGSPCKERERLAFHTRIEAGALPAPTLQETSKQDTPPAPRGGDEKSDDSTALSRQAHPQCTEWAATLWTAQLIGRL